VLTLFRIVGVIPMNILYFTGNIPATLILAGIMILTDLVDGTVARKYNITSKFGADLDAVSDKIMALSLSIPLVVKNPVLIINMLLEFSIGIVNTVSKFKGYEPKSNFVGKVKAWPLSLTIFIGYLSNILSIPSTLFNSLVIGTALLEGAALSKYIKSYNESKMNSEIEIEDINLNLEIDTVMKDKVEEKELEIAKKEDLMKEREFLLEMNTLYNNSRVKKRKKINRRK